MSDTLSAMREFRFLDDKRNASGLSDSEESRWHELATALQTLPPAEPQTDPVAYAQALIAQGYDPVQAFLHVGFTLEQVAAAGYDVTAYQQQAQSYDPHQYAMALIAQGYDVATAYQAAGLPVPDSQPAAEKAAPVQVESADDLVVEEAPPAADPTGGWAIETAEPAEQVPPQPLQPQDRWNASEPPEAVPEPARVVPMVDDVPQSADAMLQASAYGLDVSEVPPPTISTPPEPVPEPVATAAEAVASAEPAADPFAPIAPLPLPDGARPPEELAAAPTPEPEPVPEPVVAAPEPEPFAPLPPEPVPEVRPSGAEGMPELDLGGSSDFAMGEAGVQTGGGLEAMREIDLGGGEESAPLEMHSPADRPVLDARELDFGGVADVAPEPEPESARPPTLDPAIASEPVFEAEPEPSQEFVPEPEPAPVEAQLTLEPEPVVEAAPEPEPVIEGAPELLMEATPEPEPVVEAAPELVMEAAPEPEPVIEAAPEAEPAIEAAPEPAIEAYVDLNQEPPPAVEQPAEVLDGVAAQPAPDNTPWPTLSELSEWTSADRGEYAAWTYNSSGQMPYPELPPEAFAPEAPMAEVQSEPEPVLEAAPIVEAEPVLEAAPILEAEPVLEAAPIVEADPVLEAEPVLEAVPEPELEAVTIDESEFVPGASAPPEPRPPPVVQGENRVIVHLVEGAVKRGTVHDIDLGADAVVLHSQVGAETIPRGRIKAVFFMLPPGAPPPAVEGSKLRITFHDGRQLVGYSDAYDGQSQGFFVVPADARTNTQRIYVYQGAVRQVARG